jgi:hypothetical protein
MKTTLKATKITKATKSMTAQKSAKATIEKTKTMMAAQVVTQSEKKWLGCYKFSLIKWEISNLKIKLSVARPVQQYFS